MTTFLYPNFLTSRKDYFALRAFWNRSIKRALPPNVEYEAYAAERFNDGTFFFDGNPIVSAVNWRNARAIRVIQQPPDDQDEAYLAWSGRIELPRGIRSTRVVDERVIALVLTHSTWRKAILEIKRWLGGERVDG